MIRSLTVAFAALTTLVLSTPAFAGDAAREAVVARIPLDGIDPGTPAGAAHLQRRIQTAANRMCGAATRALAATIDRARCRAKVRASGVTALTALIYTRRATLLAANENR